ncbi:MAG: nucleotidyltransferase family protein [Prolixibacteraceae bacterium]|nr:nucleotidyltransferase family protein [Prolixibacteraceae bacterium]
MEAIVLAGGLGTRLRSCINDIPKPMAQVNGKPFLFYLLRYLKKQNTDRVILSVGYKHEIISDYFGSTFLDMSLIYSIENTPLGTGGAISKALKKCNDKNIFILNGDTYFPVSFSKLKEKQNQTGAEITIALKQMTNADRYGIVSMENNSVITSFSEKIKANNILINGGVSLLNKEKFEKRSFTERYSFEKEYLEKVVKQKCISGLIFDSYFLDIGIPESYMKAQIDFKKFSSQ